MPPTPPGGWPSNPTPPAAPPGYASPSGYPAQSAYLAQPAYPAQTGYAGGPALPAGVTLSSPGKRLGGMLLSLLLIFVTLGIGYLIWALIAWTKSTTPAKQVLGMKVVNANTLQPATTGEMWMRQFLWPLVLAVGNLITFGILTLVDAFMVCSDRRQRILDRMATTYVVDDPHDAWRLKR